MIDRPLISIVVPSRNQGAYLETALQSVLDQSYKAVELIVMDGGSTDGSVDLLTRYAPHLAYWSSKEDAGPAAALTEGFQHATGQIFGFLNADDFLLPGALEIVARAFTAAPDVDVLSGHGFFADPSGTLGPPMRSDRWSLRRFRYGACVLLQPATFFRRAAYQRAGGFRQTGRVCWDMELWAALAATGARFDTLNANLAAFRLHPGSLTGAEQYLRRRRTDAQAVMAEIRGRPASSMDELGGIWFRAMKFLRHPVRNVCRRAYFFTTVKRWSL